MADYTAKQGDTAPTWTDTLTYSDGTAANLTGAAVKFVMRSMAATLPTVNTAATITDATNGKVAYTPTANDTAIAGLYNAYWIVTFGTGVVQRWPTDGYLSVEIQENLETSNQTIVELDDVKDYLNLQATSRSHDNELLRFITGCTPVVEDIVGDVLPRLRDEWYDGGQYWIHLRHRPLYKLMAVSEWRGPIEYPLSIVADPAHGSIYSVMTDRVGSSSGPSRIVRRSPGGGVIAFPAMPQAVHVVYQSGRASVPDNVRLGTLELIRVNYQQTQQGGGPFGGAGLNEDGTPVGPPLGFLVPNRVRELLAPNRRHPRIA